VSSRIDELTAELQRFTAERWAGEPPDVQRLRAFSLPPMGNLPCVLYCNFDLFWAGEQLQVCRQAALTGEVPPAELTRMAALLLERTAARTAKWGMTETVALIRQAATAFREWQPASGREVATMIEQLLIALDRIQAAIDAIVPWSDLDRSLQLRAPA
jgi:hypothetical protein